MVGTLYDRDEQTQIYSALVWGDKIILKVDDENTIPLDEFKEKASIMAAIEAKLNYKDEIRQLNEVANRLATNKDCYQAFEYVIKAIDALALK